MLIIPEYKSKLYSLLIFLSLFAMITGWLVISKFCFVENEVSKNDILVFLISPLIVDLTMLMSPFLIARLFPKSVNFDHTWIQRPRTKIRWYILLIILPIFSVMITGIISKYAGLSMYAISNYKDITQLSASFFVCRTFLLAFLGPISEEVFWRGYAQDQFSRCFGKRIALFLQAFLFALYHMRPFMGFMSAFIPGLIWGFWRQKRRSLIPIIIAHVLMNGLYALAHFPDHYEFSRKKISINYLDELKRIGNTSPAGENAAPFYRKASELFVNPPQEIWDHIKENRTLNDLSDEQQEVIFQWINQNTDAIAQLKQGTHKPFCWSNYSGSIQDFMLHEKSRESELAYALCWQAARLAQNGQIEKAVDELTDCYRLGCHLTEGPKPMISKLIGMGAKRNVCKTGFLMLNSIEMSSEQILYFRTQLEPLLQANVPPLDLTCEKLELYDNIQRIFTDDGNGNGYIPRLELKGLENDPCQLLRFLAPGLTKDQIKEWVRSDRKQTTELVDELFKFFNDAITKTPMQLKDENINIGKTIDEKTENNIISMYIPSFSKIHYIFYQNEAFESAFLTTLSIFNYKSTCLGFPENLDVLVSEGYINSLPEDPYSNNPLIHKKTENSFILYSVSENFKDDGGKHSDKWNSPGNDYVFWPPEVKQD